MNFIAIDFETANEKRNSPCSIGLVVVKDGKVVEKIHHLIKPKEMRFTPMNIGIHGITPSMVENENEFDKVWEEIKDYFNESVVVAHNAAFDISVLRNTLDLYDIEAPSFKYICTMKLSKNFYLNLENAKLNTVSNFLGYKFNHHDALSDALACSNILLNISDEVKSRDINEISKLISVSIGKVDSKGYKPSSSKGTSEEVSKKNRLNDRNEFELVIKNGSFKNEVVVFTGGLSSMTRDKAMRIVRNLGGSTGGSVTKKTTCVVTNMKNIKSLKREEMTTKLRKACLYIEKGQVINIINEEEFLKIIKSS
ncbi:exonuclease domain-containing protein [Clostridium sp.]|uniref:exonuclease domain-containing protein n=1 Tax=Clostridium sp. TaxID=1506 RepID=UPI003F35505B